MAGGGFGGELVVRRIGAVEPFACRCDRLVHVYEPLLHTMHFCARPAGGTADRRCGADCMQDLVRSACLVGPLG